MYTPLLGPFALSRSQLISLLLLSDEKHTVHSSLRQLSVSVLQVDPDATTIAIITKLSCAAFLHLVQSVQ